MSKQLSHDPDAQRYVLLIDGTMAAALDYAAMGNAVSFVRTFTAPHLRGQGLAAEVTEFAVDDVEKNTELRIVPMCWYVDDWFARHPERAELLKRGL